MSKQIRGNHQLQGTIEIHDNIALAATYDQDNEPNTIRQALTLHQLNTNSNT